MSNKETMVITVFRSRLDPEHSDDYSSRAVEIAELAVQMPGYLGHKIFTAVDGERVTIVEFDSPDHQQAWATHPEHRKAMDQGRTDFYTEYDLKVANVIKHHSFPIA